MAALPNPRPTMSEQDYLTFERESELKHEFIDGEVYAMTGASESHNLISGNLMLVLKLALRGRPCKVYPADMRVKIETLGMFTYPDLSVVCGEAKFADDVFDSLINPTALIEILSPSTAAYDRGLKFQSYREIPSLKEYVLVEQDKPRIERFMLNEKGNWELTDAHGLNAFLHLPSIDCTLTLSDVYEQVTFDDN